MQLRNTNGTFAKGSSGFVGQHTEATKQLISLASKGRKVTKKQLEALEVGRKSRKGIKLSDEIKMKMSQNRRGKNVGENHPRWVGNSTEDYRERRRFRITMQRKIFERDNYTCVLCNKSGNLQVDHIKSWVKYPELRFVMENCRTLCASCHYEITFNRPMPLGIKGWGHNLMQRGSD
jgi:hypothetical protein